MFVNPSASDSLDTPGVEHDAQHANANDALEVLEAMVGVPGTAVTAVPAAAKTATTLLRVMVTGDAVADPVLQKTGVMFQPA